MTFTYRIDGVDLAAVNGSTRLLGGTRFHTGASTSRALVRAPGRHGATPVGRVLFEEPTLALEVSVRGASQDALEANVRTVLALFSGDSMTVTRVSGSLETTADARLVSVSDPEFWYGAGLSRFVIVLALPGVFWRSPYATSIQAVPGSSATVTVSSLAGSTAPVDDAVLRFWSGSGGIGAAGVTAQDVNNGTGFALAGAHPADHYVYVDCSSFRAWYVPTATADADEMWDGPGTGATEVTTSATVDAMPAGMLSMAARPFGGDPTDRRVQVDVTGATQVAIYARKAFL